MEDTMVDIFDTTVEPEIEKLEDSEPAEIISIDQIFTNVESKEEPITPSVVISNEQGIPSVSNINQFDQINQVNQFDQINQENQVNQINQVEQVNQIEQNNQINQINQVEQINQVVTPDISVPEIAQTEVKEEPVAKKKDVVLRVQIVLIIIWIVLTVSIYFFGYDLFEPFIKID